jgi:hypothetical protein
MSQTQQLSVSIAAKPLSSSLHVPLNKATPWSSMSMRTLQRWVSMPITLLCLVMGLELLSALKSEIFSAKKEKAD